MPGWMRARPPGPGRLALRPAALILLLALVAACAGTYQPMGPLLSEPRGTGDAVIAADGQALPLRSWLPQGPPEAVVLAIHGFNDYSYAFDGPGRYWAEH